MEGNKIDIFAEIKGIKYIPFLCKTLNIFSFNDIDKAIISAATFILELDKKNQIAISWWVSPKRTRSYPYTRVYDSLNFSGKKVTIIPFIKDEGKEGDRDFLQWDTISLMSLLNIYVIISYYSIASKSLRYKHKITNQRFNLNHIVNEISKLVHYQSDALHWNISQMDNINIITEKAIKAYLEISKKLGIDMHSWEQVLKRANNFYKNKDTFMSQSRDLAKIAQERERVTIQPKEKLFGTKGTITIKNYLGGNYYFTCDETEIHKNEVYLIEDKHTKGDKLPSWGDIKDGLFKMALFTNLSNVKINEKHYNFVPILKLTSGNKFNINDLSISDINNLDLLIKEARVNNFRVMLNKDFL